MAWLTNRSSTQQTTHFDANRYTTAFNFGTAGGEQLNSALLLVSDIYSTFLQLYSPSRQLDRKPFLPKGAVELAFFFFGGEGGFEIFFLRIS